mgnify:CR=1 FL=1
MDTQLGRTFVNNTGTVDDDTSLKNSKVVCLYFSANWCPPCQGFTPILVDFYKNINAETKQLEIIFVSLDKEKEGFEKHHKDMPWLAVPFGDVRVDKLINYYEVKGIPTLILIDKNGKAVSKTARQEVLLEGTDKFARWVEKVEE